MATKLVKCSCLNAYQDKMYGKGNRVHNSCKKSLDWWRCTVCLKERIDVEKKS